jgi:hypothetical protein
MFNELEIILKKAIAALSEYCNDNYLEALRDAG